MATEIEAKLAVSPRAMQRAARLPWLRKLARGAATRTIVSTYFDTPKLKLRRHGLTLRIRRIGRQRLQTIKAAGVGVSGREEHEHEVAGDTPDLARAKRSALKPLITRKLKRSLLPVFETRMRRTTMQLRVGRSEIEAAFDRGTIKAGRSRMPVSEIELELKSGSRRDLARVVKRLRQDLPIAYGARTKAERGYALHDGTRDAPVAASAIALQRDATAGDAFAVIGLACLHHLAANAGAVRAGHPEGVHQMRVGLRRLRAAISVFKAVVANAETDRIKGELKWLAGELGPARNFDVVVQESVTPLRRDNPAIPEMRLLETDLKKRREAAFARAKAAVESERCRRIELDTVLWLIDGKWSRGAGSATRRAQPVARFAREALRTRTRKIVKKGRKIAHLAPRRRHELRIAVKKLRYATAFFASLFDDTRHRKSRKRFEKDLKTLQSALGKLNDMAVRRRLARTYAHPRPRSRKAPQKAFAAGLLTGREQSRAAACIAAAVAAAEGLAEAEAFWGSA
jgi:triphosphatase